MPWTALISEWCNVLDDFVDGLIAEVRRQAEAVRTEVSVSMAEMQAAHEAVLCTLLDAKTREDVMRVALDLEKQPTFLSDMRTVQQEVRALASCLPTTKSERPPLRRIVKKPTASLYAGLMHSRRFYQDDKGRIVIRFGKHDGEFLADAVASDAEYWDWFLENVDDILPAEEQLVEDAQAGALKW